MATPATLAPIRQTSLAHDIVKLAVRLRVPVRRRRIPRGELNALEDGRGSSLHVLVEGRAKLVRFSSEGRVMMLDLLKPEDVFGDLRDDGPDPSFVEALEDSVMVSIRTDAVERMMEREPSLLMPLARLLSERCRWLEKRLETQVFHRVPERLAQQLLELADRHGVPTPDGVLIPVHLSQQDLANLIGASREIVSLTLSEFRRRGLVEVHGRRLLCRDRLRDQARRQL